MTEGSLEERLQAASNLLASLVGHSERLRLAQEIQVLEAEVADPGLWGDQLKAKAVTSALSRKKKLRAQADVLHETIGDLHQLNGIIAAESDPASFDELQEELSGVEAELSNLETELLLNGEYDSRGAVMTIRSGAGGDDATDFAQTLMRMYLRYCEKHSMPTSVVDISNSEGAGIKSVVVEIDAPFAFGRLSVETGTHRLVRMSPFNAAGKRQTSFAAVEVVPLIESSNEVVVDDSELRIDVFRSSGPGGQSVNTTDSAVRITHIPSGIVVSCQNEKSQLQNKQAAMRVLQSKLLDAQHRKEEEKKKELSGDVRASWGEQMRSYVLAPYQMVKDLRTQYEVNNPDAVFDGDLEGFIAAGIRWRKIEKLTP